MFFFLTGIYTKISDNIVDKNLFRKEYGYLFSITSGIIFAYLFSSSVGFATLISAILISLILAGKFDHKIHLTTPVFFLMGVFVFGMGQLNILFFFIILIASFSDEFINDNFKSPFAKYRMLLGITCLALSLVSLDPSYFVGIFSFDVGYIITEMFTN